MNVAVATFCMGLTIRLSDAGLRYRQTKLLYPDHRLPPWLACDATRDRSNRLLENTIKPFHSIVVLPARTQQLFVP
jgi:hypothetical protein